MSSRPRINFDIQPSTTNSAIRSFYDTYLKENRDLTLRPAYQRNLCWSEQQKSDLIDTIMSGCPMPIFLLYMCCDTNECIDGQNRLNTIKEYIEQKSATFAWKNCIESDDGTIMIENVFYKQNEGIDAYIEAKKKKTRKNSVVKTYRYMTEEEMRKFHKYKIASQMIETKLTLDQRKEIFLKWQNGRPINQCDRLKNESYPFCILVVNRSLETCCADRISPLLKSGKDNWLYDLYRMLLVFHDATKPIGFSAQNTIKSLGNIKKPDGDYKLSDEEYVECTSKLHRFLDSNSALHELPKDFKKLSFIITFAYIWFKSTTEQRKFLEDAEFVNKLVQKCRENSAIKYNSLNNGPHSTELSLSFPLIKTIVDDMICERTPVDPAYKKKKVPAAVKTQAWYTYVGESIGETKCLCCRVIRITQSDFIAGHIIPEAKGGAATVENIRPICPGCNLSMGMRNMRDYMAEHHPGNRLP